MVLAIVAIMAGVALPAYSGAVARYRLQAAAQQLANDMDRAADYAWATMSTVGVDFDLATHSVRFTGLPSRTDAASDYRLDLSAHPYGAGISSANFSGQPRYTISPFGVPSSGGTVVLRGADAAKTITVDAATAAVSLAP